MPGFVKLDWLRAAFIHLFRLRASSQRLSAYTADTAPIQRPYSRYSIQRCSLYTIQRYSLPLCSKGHDVRLLLVETYGGFGTDLNRLFRAAAHSQANALSKAQLDDQASWSTRSWTALQGQRLSLAIQTAVAYEIINELGYGDGAATTAARGAAAEAAMNVDEGTGEDDAAWAAGEGDGLGGREGA